MKKHYNRRMDMKTRFTRAKRRNLVDAIPGLHDCILILDGMKPDFNIGKIIRSADAFGIKEVHLTGVEYFDPEPAKGSMRWVLLHQHQDFAACYEGVSDKGYSFFCMDAEGKNMLGLSPLPDKLAFIIGHEEFGVSFKREDYPEIQSITIQQWGKVQSLNASVAASIAMFEYTRQHGLREVAPPKRTPSWSVRSDGEES